MREHHIYVISIAVTVVGVAFIAFFYLAVPRSFAEVATKGSVVIGAYSIDRAAFEQGVDSFKRDQFVEARAAFERADPEKRDPATQYYVAYSYYRQGWGRLSNDDALFGAGLEAVDRVIALDPAFRSTDETLGFRSPADLKNELEEGLKITASDLDPRKLVRERK